MHHGLRGGTCFVCSQQQDWLSQIAIPLVRSSEYAPLCPLCGDRCSSGVIARHNDQNGRLLLLGYTKHLVEVVPNYGRK